MREQAVGRKRQGLLDGIYGVLGIAAESDIGVLRAAVNEAKVNTKILFHNQEQLLSVFKKNGELVALKGNSMLGTIRHLEEDL